MTKTYAWCSITGGALCEPRVPSPVRPQTSAGLLLSDGFKRARQSRANVTVTNKSTRATRRDTRNREGLYPSPRYTPGTYA